MPELELPPYQKGEMPTDDWEQYSLEGIDHAIKHMVHEEGELLRQERDPVMESLDQMAKEAFGGLSVNEALESDHFKDEHAEQVADLGDKNNEGEMSTADLFAFLSQIETSKMPFVDKAMKNLKRIASSPEAQRLAEIDKKIDIISEKISAAQQQRDILAAKDKIEKVS